MERYFWFSWWFLFYCGHSRLFWICSQKHETVTENPPVKIYLNKNKNRIVFKVKAGCILELLSLETMKLLGSTKKDVGKDKDGEDVSKLESAEVI